MSKEEDILYELKCRFQETSNFESKWRSNALADLQFFLGDSYNNGQWDAGIYTQRMNSYGGPKPCLTINKTQTHVFQVENDCRQNQMSVKVNGTGFGSSGISADALESIIRHIEYRSNAVQNAYMSAIQGQIRQGIGWVHIVTEYEDSESFNQDFLIKSVPNPLSVYIDPNCCEPDHSDAKFGIIREEISKSTFKEMFPDHDDLNLDYNIAGDDVGNSYQHKDTCYIYRYYRKSERKDVLYAVPNDQGVFISVLKSKISKEESKIYDELGYKKRKVTNPFVEFYTICGNTIIESGDTVFKRIPLVPFIGIETIFEGRLDRKGLVRALIDPQRMYNYSASSYVESIALQTKSPWLVDDRSIEGYEDEWASSNVSNAAWLPYRSVDPENPQIQLNTPQRLDPPSGSTGHLQAMQNADLQMQMSTGQYSAEMGAPGNERTGIAIQQRQRQSDTATYHYTDNQGMAIRLIGKILIESIPYIYDTKRAITCMNVDGSQQQIVIDPTLQTAHNILLPNGQQAPQGMSEEDQLEIKGAILAINPNIGKYDVESDVGPAFATRRQETFNALTQLVTASPGLMSVVGDLIFKSADFPLADEIADRIKTNNEQQQQNANNQQIQQLQQTIQSLQQKLQDKTFEQNYKMSELQHDKVVDLMNHDAKVKDIQVKEMSAIGSIAPEALLPVLRNLVVQVLHENNNSNVVNQNLPMVPNMNLQDTHMPKLPSDNPQGGLISGGDSEVR